ncbi:MAG TPA: c-type cytochrome, partial [Flavisolibacter sp.]|nr:c-type cytochrome [Flavisolibacter sp.]
GYDEVNQARKAGYFGWPFFVGNNYAYLNHDYTTGVNGAPFNAAQPMNVSRNNTGLQALPPAQPAFIYYPYDFSKDFPQVGSGGRNAMSGPVYYVEDFPKDTRYPSYFNGKLFIYEWMRNWIKLVQMRPGGDFDKMEAFMESTKWNSPIDMEVGPDGRVYVLEYGSGWFSKNADAGLSRIDFIGGNRPPKVDSLKVAKESGALPYTFTATVNAKDPEGDKLTYRWLIGKTVKETTEPRLQYTIDKVGEYDLSVEVVDDKKGSSKSGSVILNAGNEQPEVEIAMEGNKSFYFPGKPLNYSVKIGDGGAKIDTANVFVTTAYIEGGEDLALQGHQVVPETIMGRNLTASMDCKSCHKVAEKSIGPPYMQVSQRYRKDPKASSFLIEKIIKGGAGNWGDVAMPAHPTLKEGDAKMMITWILSLGAEGSKSLPLAGKIIPQQGSGAKAITLTASYTDVGGAGLRPLTGSKVVYLRSSFMDLGRTRTGNAEGFDRKDSAGARYLVMPEGQGSLKLEGVDVTGLKGIELSGFGMGAPAG